MMTLAQSSVTLKAGEVRPIAVTASIFSCASADAPFNISFNGGAYIPMQAGWTVDNRPNLFTSIILQNPSAVAITIAFYATTCAISYSPVTNLVVSTNAPTYAKGSGLLNPIAGATLTFTGVDNGKARKQIVITNMDAAAALYVRDAAGNAMAPVLAGQVWTMETNAGLQLYNPNGAPVSCYVGETFYA